MNAHLELLASVFMDEGRAVHGPTLNLCGKRHGADDDRIEAGGGVRDEDGSMRCDLDNRHDNHIELLAHPDVRALVLLGELLERLFAFNVFLPEFNTDSGIASC